MSVDASNLPVCLLTVEGQGLDETQLHDYLQFTIRNQIAGVPGATVPPPYGGKYRQIMVYVDPLKLQANQLLSLIHISRSGAVLRKSGVHRRRRIFPRFDRDIRLGPPGPHVASPRRHGSADGLAAKKRADSGSYFNLKGHGGGPGPRLSLIHI